MTIKIENLTRALAILTAEPSDTEVTFKLHALEVCGQHLSINDADDAEVLSVLMVSKEFGFAVTWQEMMSDRLRTMQNVWFDAAKDKQIENTHARKARLDAEAAA